MKYLFVFIHRIVQYFERRKLRKNLKIIEETLAFYNLSNEEQAELFEASKKLQDNKIKPENIDVSTKVQVYANISGTIIMASIAIVTIFFSLENSKEQRELNIAQFDKVYKRDSTLNISQTELIEREVSLAQLRNQTFEKQFVLDSTLQSMGIEIANKQYRLIEAQQKIEDEINLTSLNNFMLDYFANYYLPYHKSFELMNKEQIIDWFEKIDLLMEKETDNPLLVKNEEILQLWRDAMSNNKIALVNFKAGNFEGNFQLKSGIKGFVDTTNSRIIKIYNSINKKYGNQTFFKIR